MGTSGGREGCPWASAEPLYTVLDSDFWMLNLAEETGPEGREGVLSSFSACWNDGRGI